MAPRSEQWLVDGSAYRRLADSPDVDLWLARLQRGSSHVAAVGLSAPRPPPNRGRRSASRQRVTDLGRQEGTRVSGVEAERHVR